MTIMKLLKVIAPLIMLGVAPMLSTQASAQAMSGRQLEDRNVVNISYYKTPPGMQDEWMALYLKWHRPIMDYLIQRGWTLSSTVYANTNHTRDPDWDFLIISVGPAPQDKEKSRDMIRGQILQHLYPDLNAYYEGEKARWAMTEDHWDLDMVEVDLTAKIPGVYWPIIPGEH